MNYLAIFSLLFLSISASAQQANFSSSNAKHDAGIHTQFNCSLTDFSGPEQLATFVGKMKASTGILKLDVLSSTPTSAELRIVTSRENDSDLLQQAFAAAGVATISYDEKIYKTTRFAKVIDTQK